MTKVHVLAGGSSTEREVSLRSGASVTAALKTAGYEIIQLDPASIDMDVIAACDVVFPALHGTGGEDGTLQKQLEARNVKYVGSDSVASALCFDKGRYREFASAHDLPIAEGALVQVDTYKQHPLTAHPYVLKPYDGGSSIGTYIVRDPSTAPHEQIIETFQEHPTMLMEELIVGIELTVGILGNTPLPVTEIIPPKDGDFDYENKYNGATQELCPPQHVSEAVQKSAQDLALRAHKLTNCRDLSRTDIMYGQNGQLYVLETNTLPGMTDQSLYPKMAQASGLSMVELCSQLVEAALKH